MNNVCIRYADDTYTGFLNYVGAETPCRTVNRILEDVFQSFNNGSGRETKAFLDLNIRSLSVDDFVSVDGVWYRCTSDGWKRVTDRFVFKWFLELARRLDEMGGHSRETKAFAASVMHYSLWNGELVLNG